MVRLRCIEDNKYEMQYHYHLQGFIYNLLKGSKYDYVHDKDGYKFFCFSNIFPAYDLKEGQQRTLIVSCPDDEFIQYLYDVLTKPWNRTVAVGSMKFHLADLEKISTAVPNSHVRLITGTPVITRIKRAAFLERGVEPKGKYDVVYWRSDYPIDLFMTAITKNLLQKYRSFSEHQGREFQESPPAILFEKFMLKKQVSTRVEMKDRLQVLIGTLWELETSGSIDRGLVNFMLDSGIGERNSLGFGFLNLNNK